MSNPSVVGIDLGTTFSLAAYSRDGRPEAVRDAAGVALVPSCLSFHPSGGVLVGSAARARALADPEHTVFSVKRLMGRTLADLTDDLPLIPHQLVERAGPDGRAVLRVKVGDAEYTPEELSAMILKEVRQRAGHPTKAVITVPAYFDDAQRQATRDAGRIAGLDVLRIVNEPTAAALAYGLDRKKTGTVAVYDLGGGTFDCSVLSLQDGVFRVLSTNGDTRLGGDDFDRALMTHVAAEAGIDLSAKDAELLQHLRDAAERTKIALTAAESAEFTLDLASNSEASGSEASGLRKRAGASPTQGDPTGEQAAVAHLRTSPVVGDAPARLRRPLAFRKTITRGEFESLIAPLVDRSLARCKAALKDAGQTPADINDVVLVGGSTRVPLVRRKVEEFFGRKPHTDLNPDEVVALGAAVQADILAGGRRDVLLLDVVPLSLGIETLGGVVDKVIHRNTPVPCRETVRYSTFADNQTAILINIYQGERELTKDCRRLGAFKLAGIPPMPAQMPQVDVTFVVDANGQLTVTAREQRSGQEARVEVTAAHGLSQDEVEKLVLESVEHAHADFTTRRFVELKNKGDADLRHAERALSHLGAAVPAAERSAVEAAAAELKAAMAASDVTALQRAVDAFGNATAPLAERQMNATVKAMLAGRTEDQIDATP